MDDQMAHSAGHQGGVARPLSRGQLVALDALAVVALLALAPSFNLVPGAAERPVGVPGWVEFLLAAGTALPVAARRIWPLPVFCLVAAVTLASLLLGVARDPFVAASFALYTVALDAPRRGRRRTLPLGLLSMGLLGLVTSAGVLTPRQVPGGLAQQAAPSWTAEVGVLLLGLAVLGGTWTVGRAVAERRAATERAAAQLAARAVTDERLRIARELHDVVAHSMSLIAVKAGVANHVLAQRPEAAKDALEVIETTSRGSLNEMRHLLGVLRSEDPYTIGLGELGPAPGPAGLPALAGRAEQAGVRVTLDVRGVDGLGDGVGLSVYRIVQEALTNVVKHAAPARCQVTVAADGDTVHVEVTDDGGGRAPPAEGAGGVGHGLIGMRERVMLYGGSLRAGPRPGGGFRVSARLPYQPGAEPGQAPGHTTGEAAGGAP